VHELLNFQFIKQNDSAFITNGGCVFFKLFQSTPYFWGWEKGFGEMVYWKNVNDAEVYSPPGHEGTYNRRLVGPEEGIENMEVIIGEMEPGGLADPHFHEDLEQIMYVLTGKMHIIIEGEETILTQGDVVWIPKKALHKVTNAGDENLRFVLMYSPQKV
jgi:quercetin dioxygenase-like cupin family protein